MASNKPVIDLSDNEVVIKRSGKESQSYWENIIFEVTCFILQGKCAVAVASSNELENPFGGFSDQVMVWRTADLKYIMAVCKKWSREDIEEVVTWRFHISDVWFQILDEMQFNDIMTKHPSKFYKLTGALQAEGQVVNSTLECLGCVADGDWIEWYNPKSDVKDLIRHVLGLYESQPDHGDDLSNESVRTCILL